MQPPLNQPDPAFDRLLDKALAPEPMPEGLDDRLMTAIASAQKRDEVLARIGPVSGRAWSSWRQAALAACILLAVGLALWWPSANTPSSVEVATIEQTVQSQLARWDDTAQRIDAPRDELDQSLAELAGQLALADASLAFDESAPTPPGSDNLDDSINLLMNEWDTALF
jgi:hypothetical protein